MELKNQFPKSPSGPGARILQLLFFVGGRMGAPGAAVLNLKSLAA